MPKSDPKPAKRIIDPLATRRAILRHPTCAACEQPAATGHHILQKGAPHFGDDVVENIVGLCGSGTSGCHGAIHGSPYIAVLMDDLTGDLIEARRDGAWVAWMIGETLARHRGDVIIYVLKRLGEDPGIEYLRRFYPSALEIGHEPTIRRAFRELHPH